MTGAEHYREAERLLEAIELVDDANPSDGFYGQSADELVVWLPQIQAAQVHATLALVAAHRDTADPGQLWEPPKWT